MKHKYYPVWLFAVYQIIKPNNCTQSRQAASVLDVACSQPLKQFYHSLLVGRLLRQASLPRRPAQIP